MQISMLSPEQCGRRRLQGLQFSHLTRQLLKLLLLQKGLLNHYISFEDVNTQEQSPFITLVASNEAHYFYFKHESVITFKSLFTSKPKNKVTNVTFAVRRITRRFSLRVLSAFVLSSTIQLRKLIAYLTYIPQLFSTKL